MACSTANVFDIVCRLDSEGKLDEAPQNKKQKVATGLLRDNLYEQDFELRTSCTTRKLYHVLLVLSSLLASYAFHATDSARLKDFTLKSAVLDAQIKLTLFFDYNECPRLCDMFKSFRRQATVLPRRNQLLHNLITQVFLRSLQYGIVVMGFIDAIVYAHHQHRRSIENPGNFGDCMKGRIFFMTAITPAYAHAYQATCLTRHMPAVPHHKFRLPKPKARYPHLPTLVPQHVKEAMISKDGPFIQMEVLAS